MTVDLQTALKKYWQYRDTLVARWPQSQVDADTLADHVVDCRTASADDVWRAMWDKPLYANRRLAAAERLVKWAEPHMQGVWRSDNRIGPFSVSRKPKHLWADPAGKSNESFRDETGAKVDEFQRNGIAYQFTFAIVEAGRYLKARSAKFDPPLADFADEELEVLVRDLTKRLGFNWGHITVLHFLTDLGLACKPDIHLVRTMDALGLCTCRGKRPTFKEAIEMNRVLKGFLPLAYSEDGPRNLRHLDKMLMEMSRQQVLPSAIYDKWPEDQDEG